MTAFVTGSLPTSAGFARYLDALQRIAARLTAVLRDAGPGAVRADTEVPLRGALEIARQCREREARWLQEQSIRYW